MDDGGWECYLGSPEEGEDPAVFQSKHARRDEKSPEPEAANGTSANPVEPDLTASSAKPESDKPKPSISMNGQGLEFDSDQFSPSDFDSDSSAGGSDDGPLLTHPVGFNKLMIVLRDPGVMRFVKYLSAGAKGSRWDVGGEWEVGVMEEDEDA